MKKKKGTTWRWIVSVILVLFAIVSFSSLGIISGLLFLICAVYVCPLFKSFLEQKGIVISKVLGIAGVVIVFLIACIAFPSSKNESAEISEIEGSVEETTILETKASETEASETQASETQAPETKAPETKAPETKAPETKAPETKAPETKAPETKAPETQAPETQAPETKAPETQAPETQAPETQASNWDPYKGNVTFNGHYYATPTGKCYHYSIECGGENSREISEQQAMHLKPCGTCVLK